jgi:hypothetical protein
MANSKFRSARTTPVRAYNQYERLLLRLHELIAGGHAESDDAEHVRDLMDEPWALLSDGERHILGGLSADLYMLSGTEIREDTDEKATAEDLDSKRAMLYKRKKWPEFLDAMRRGPTTIQPDFIAFFRARAYDELGLKASAARFTDFADSLVPKDSYKALAMERYRESGELEAAVDRARAVAAQSGPRDPGLLVMAAGVLFASTRDMSGEEAVPVYEHVKTLVDIALNQAFESVDVQVSALILKGLAHEFLQEVEAAREAFTRAEQLAPLSPVARAAKAGLSPSGAPRARRDRKRRIEIASRVAAELSAA